MNLNWDMCKEVLLGWSENGKIQFYNNQVTELMPESSDDRLTFTPYP